ncbi:MAG: YaiO family outer membrane beta-barrel protein, partial [Elusimicrobiota bacterium]|nr:YaiO family outer membrane beta-barrel protein [Elusimicrobiota bacterium]
DEIPSTNTRGLEFSFSLEELRPYNFYGAWKTSSLKYAFTPSWSNAAFIQIENLSRDSGKSVIASGSAYKDWTDKFYTYSSLSFGSNSDYTQKLRFDNNFNFKTLENKNLVLTFGVSYIKYHDVHEDQSLSFSPTLYAGHWIFSYRYARNKSNPGSVFSNTQTLSAGFGEEYKKWIFLTLNSGTQSYMATYLLTPEKIDQSSKEVMLNIRYWLKQNSGFTSNISWMELKDAYKKHGFSLGYFYNF